MLLLVVVSITGCRGKILPVKGVTAPRPFGMGSPPADADPLYLSGWNDGCDTGLSAMVTGYYKSHYQFTQDPYKANNPVYYKAWKDAYTYCNQYAFRFIWDPIDNNNNKSQDNPLCVLCPNELR